MPRTRVRSSNLESVGYDPETKTLEVEFKGRTVYQYYGVPEAMFVGLMKARSKGTYLSEHIKDRYRYRKL
jgi:hypothetical protein